MERKPHPLLMAGAGGVLVLLVAVAVYFLFLTSDDEAKATTIRFSKAAEVGDHPFTAPADKAGPDTVRVKSGAPLPQGQGPFGGSGSNRVCDRELLIRSLTATPQRMREWARVLGVAPTKKAVAAYIRRLRPSTLTRDTRVTNHTYENGEAVPIQGILQAGTAVLVDSRGNPVVRCRCGNPLTEALPTPSEVDCVGCPVNYDTASVCTAGSNCYARYPHPPPVQGSTGGCGPFTFLTYQATAEVHGVSCQEGRAVIERYGRIGGAASFDGWLCGAPSNPVFGLVSCRRGSQGVIARQAGSGRSSSGSGAGQTQTPKPDPNVSDCSSVDTPGPGGVGRVSARGLSCAEAMKVLAALGSGNGVHIPGWDCALLNGDGAEVIGTYRCTQGAKAIRFTTGD